MASYEDSRPAQGAVYPINAVETQWGYLQPLITPEQFIANFVLGIPLGFKDPLTQALQQLTPENIAEIINRAVVLAEIELQIQITPIQVSERHPFDRNLYRSFMFFNTHHRPCSSIEALTIRTSNGDDIFTVPPAWIEVGKLQIGQINVIPLVPAYASSINNSSAISGANSIYLSIMEVYSWIPTFWNVLYTAGFKDMKIPSILNELIGAIAAMELLSMLAAILARSQGMSLSIDGISQSFSTPGGQLYRIRMDELNEKKKMIIKKIKNMYKTIAMTNF